MDDSDIRKAADLMLQGCREIEREFDLRSGFFLALTDDDDWSFVIKLHALFEAACSHLLTTSNGDHRLQRLFDRLPLSDTDTGKLAFLKELELLDRSQLKMVRALSELRNQLVHRIGNIGFTFSDHLASLDDNQLLAFAKAFTDVVPDADARESRRQAITRRQDVKLVVWTACLGVIIDMLLKIELTKQDRARTKQLLDAATAALHDAQAPVDEDDEVDP